MLDHLDPALQPLWQRSGLAPLVVRGRRLLPVVQGGMGVGVSAHRLAGSVAAQGAVGTLSAIDLRRHHPDLMARGAEHGTGPGAKDAINAANREALQREIAAARTLAAGRGLRSLSLIHISEPTRPY